MGKQVDKNDFWFIENNPITKVGVYPYLGKQISQDCEPDKIYYVLRPKEELFRKETLDSLRLIPLIDGHTMIGKDFTAPEDKGLDGTLGDNVSHDTDTIYNDLKIISNKMKEEIKNGKKELSLGYFCRYDKQPGTYKGQRYDYVQRDIIANHLALVDKGRMGADVRVYDSKNIPEGEAFAMDSIDIAADREFKESDVNRDNRGRFATKGSSGLNSEKVKRFRELLDKKDTQTIEKEFGKKIYSDKAIEQLKSSLWLKYDKGSKDPNLPDFEYLKSDEEPEQNNGGNEEKGKENPFERTLRETGFQKDDNNYSYSKEYKDGTVVSVHSEKNDDSGKFYIADIVDKNGNMSQKEYHYQGIEDVFNKLNKEYEKSKPEQAGKNKGTQDSMEYKTIQGEGKMADKKEKVAIDEDKRKLIDEIGGILKDEGLDDEIIRTVIGKAEKIAYNKSEAGDDGEEVEEEVIEEENEEKDKKPAKDKCGKDEEKDEDKEEEEKKKVVKAFAQKEKLGKEVEDALGTFDHSEMTELEIAKYACDKLDLQVEKGQEISAVKGYLKGLAKAPKATFGYKTVAADSGIEKEDPEFEKFSKGE